MAVLNINALFWTQDVEIREDGVIDEDVVEAFSRGHCHSFALALHRATGWEMVGSLWSDWARSDFSCDEDCDHKGHGVLHLEDWPYADGDAIHVPEHVLCRDPKGGLWDIGGLYRPGDCYEDAAVIDPALVEDGLCGTYRTPEPEIASTFIDAWMEAHQ